MADTRPDRRKARQNDAADQGGQAQQESLFDLEQIVRATTTKNSRERKAFDSGEVNPSGQLRFVVKLGAMHLVRLDRAHGEFLSASATVVKQLETQIKTGSEKDQRKAASELREVRRNELSELRRTQAIQTGLAAVLLKAAKVGHDCELDEFLDEIEIEGTAHMREQLTGGSSTLQ